MFVSGWFPQYGTSYWQVGENVHQNGCFKMALTRFKQELLTKKEGRQAEFAIEKDDIVDLVARAYKVSFVQVDNNLNAAIAEKGWGPLNYRTLLPGEIHLSAVSATQTELKAAISTITPTGLNLNLVITSTLLDKVIERRNREDSRNGTNLDQMTCQRKELALLAIAQNKR
jgi:hypothetical protein